MINNFDAELHPKLLSQVKEIIARISAGRSDASKIGKNDGLFDALEMDSLDVIELCMELEKEFMINIPDHDVEEWRTVSHVVGSVLTLVSGK